MQTLFIVITVLVLLWLLASRVPLRYQVERSVQVRASREAVYEQIADLREWKHWSPWLVHDTATELTYQNPTELGGFYTWKSARIGEGKVTHTALDRPDRLQMDLLFIKPFKSQAKVGFVLSDAGPGLTDVRWTMDSQLPFFMRPMLGMFKRMIGLDFEFGLLRLAQRVDASAECPEFTFEGPVSREAQSLVTERYSGPLADIAAAMDKGYAALRERVGDQQQGAPLALYDKMDAKARTTVCDMALPVAAGSDLKPLRQLPAGRYYRVLMRGHYRFMELAWHNAFGHLRMDKIKPQMQRPCIEVYVNDPKAVPDSNQWVTELLIPIA